MGGCMTKIEEKGSSNQHFNEILLDPRILQLENIENPSQNELKTIAESLKTYLEILKNEKYSEQDPFNEKIYKAVHYLRNKGLKKYMPTIDIIRFHYQIVKYLYFYGKDKQSLQTFAELQKRWEDVVKVGYSWLNIKLFKLMIFYRIQIKFDADLSEEISFTKECFQIFFLIRKPSETQMQKFIVCLYKHYHLSIQYKMREDFQRLTEKEQNYLKREDQNLDKLKKELKNITQKTMCCEIGLELIDKTQYFQKKLGFKQITFPSFQIEQLKNQYQNLQMQHYLQKNLPKLKQKQKGECYQKLQKSTLYLWEEEQFSNFLLLLKGGDRKRPIIFPFMNINAVYFSHKSEEKRIELYRHKKYVEVGVQVWEKLHYFGSGMEVNYIQEEKKQLKKQKAQELNKSKSNKKQLEVQTGNQNQDVLEDVESSQNKNTKEKHIEQNFHNIENTLEKPKMDSTRQTSSKQLNDKHEKHQIYQKKKLIPVKNFPKRNLSQSEYPQRSKQCQFQYKQIEFTQKQSSRRSVNSYYNEVPGLINIGNTCYLNSALQCLHKTIPFQDNFLNEGRKIFFEGNKPLASEYFNLIPFLWGKKKTQVYRPQKIKKIIAESNVLFSENKQNDAMECLSTFLQVIGEEMNTASKQKVNVEIDHGNMKDSQIYARTKYKNEVKEKSIIDDTFTGRYKTTYQCIDCHQLYTLFEKFNIHYIPLPPPDKRFIWERNHNEKKPKLVECLRSFQNAQFMTGDDKMNCARCKKDMQTSKRMAIYKANKVLVIGLKRFHQGQKNDIKIDIPLQLDPYDFVECKSEYRNKVYKLYAVLLHNGTLRGGHYKAVCYNPQSQVQSWMEYDDSYVRRCSIKDIQEQNVYGIFYSLADRQENKKNQLKKQVHSQSHITKAPY